MSAKELAVMNMLLHRSHASDQTFQMAAAVCVGGKVLQTAVNTSRSKYGRQLRVCGHAEVACLFKVVPSAFRRGCQGGKEERVSKTIQDAAQATQDDTLCRSSFAFHGRVRVVGALLPLPAAAEKGGYQEDCVH